MEPAAVFPFAIADAVPLDLEGADVDVSDLAAFSAFLAARRGTAPALIGGYNEHRGLYRGSALFGDAEEPRVIHLGVDVWTGAGTPIAAPLPAEVHSFADNDNFGDYGATIILEHAGPCWTLWGHLARRSLAGLVAGQPIALGQVFAWLGEPHENGGWPPHLHLQKITDLLGLAGDYPGVARLSERERWLALCPDPADLLV